MIHVVTGPPCAGKSTYIREHAEPGELVVDFDAIAKALGAVDDHKSDGMVLEAARAARAAAIEVAKAGDAGWIIDTYLTGTYPETAEIVLLDPGKDVCIERAKERPEGTVEEIEKWYSRQKGGRTMDLKYKSFESALGESGTISGYFSTYDKTPDSYGDIIEPGAFTETLAKRAETGHPFPLCWNHDLDQIIGTVDTIEDTEKGPLMTASFFDTPLAQEKREIVKSGCVYQFSFAYSVTGWREPTMDEKAVGVMNVLTAVDLFEVSIVPIPANQNAVMTEVKAGRRNSQKDADALKEIIRLAKGILGELDDAEEPEEGEDEAKANTAVEEPEQSNPEKENLLAYIKNMKEVKCDEHED